MRIQSQLNDLTNRRLAIQNEDDLKLPDGVLTARQRINSLVDENSFVEIGAFVTQRATDFNLDAQALPADGVVTGYGTLEGRLVYVYAQDSNVLGGAIGEMHAMKIVKIYEMAINMGAPIIGLLDSAGLRLQESTDALNAFGNIYMKQSQASGVIPQISAVLGTCGGGTAIMTSLSDFTLITKTNSKLFVNSPNTYSDETGDELQYASADFNAKESGLVDVVYDTEKELFLGLRGLIELLPANNRENAPFTDITDDPNRESDQLALAVEDGFDGLKALSEIADNQLVLVLKEQYGSEIVTALGKMNGMTVGFIASQTTNDTGRLTVNGLQKTTEFVNFCDAFGMPVVSLIDIFGYETSLAEEKAGLAKVAAKLSATFANSSIPKINIITNRGYGSAYVSFNSKHIGADVVFAWPNAEISMMDAENAVRIMYADEIDESNVPSEVIAAKIVEYREKQSNPYSAASRGYIDDIIEPGASRKRIIVSLEMLFSKSVAVVDRKHSTI